MVVELISGTCIGRKWQSYDAAWPNLDTPASRGLQGAQFYIHPMEENDAL